MLCDLNRAQRHGDGGLRRIDDGNAERLLERDAVPRHPGTAHYYGLRAVLVLQRAADFDHPRQRCLAGRRLCNAHIERPFADPPGMAAEALDILRRAFDKIVRDPAFLAEAVQLNLDVDPHSGEEVARIVADIVGTPPAIVRKLRDIIVPRESEGKSKSPEQQD